MQKESLFIPSGYGRGDIVYDKENSPYLVGASIGGSLHEIKSISDEEAKTRINTGAGILKSI